MFSMECTCSQKEHTAPIKALVVEESAVEKVAEVFDFEYLEAQKGSGKNCYIVDGACEKFERADELSDMAKALRDKIKNTEERCVNLSAKLLYYYPEYLKLYAEFIKSKASDNDDAAKNAFEEFKNKMGKNEIFIQEQYDHFLAVFALRQMLRLGRLL